jgi:heat shock protein HslJ
MTDDLMDARLRDAGARWRAASTADAPGPAAIRIAPPVRHRRRWVAAVSAAVVAAGLAVGGVLLATGGNSGGTHVAAPQSTTPLVGTRWQLREMVDRDGRTSNAARTAYLQISGNDQLAGSDGCNSIGGTVRVSRDTIDFRGISSTAMACLDRTVSRTASAVDAVVVAGTARYRLGNGTLTITRPGAGTLVYAAAGADSTNGDPDTLSGRTWHLRRVTYGGGLFAHGHVASATTDLILSAHGYRTTQRCYTTVGAASSDSQSITFSGGRAVDVVPCPGLAGLAGRLDGEQSQAVDAVLQGPVDWHVTRETLTLHRDGAGTLLFTSG